MTIERNDRMYELNRQFNTPLYYFPVIGAERINGVTTKKYGDKCLFYGSFKTYGGTDVQKNGVYAVEDTASIETWYDPMFDSGGRVALAYAENKSMRSLESRKISNSGISIQSLKSEGSREVHRKKVCTWRKWD